jgi:hypothetical protein
LGELVTYHGVFKLAASIICQKQDLSLLSEDPVQVAIEMDLIAMRTSLS